MKTLIVRKKSICCILLVFVASFEYLNAEERIHKDDRAKLKADSVSLAMRYNRGIYAYVAGEVTNPIRIVCEIKGGDVVNLEDAIAKAGGRTKSASLVHIFIIRANKLYRLFPHEGNLREIILEGGDLVFLPPKTVAGR